MRILFFLLAIVASMTPPAWCQSNPTLSVNDVSQFEGNSGTASFRFTVTLSAASTQNVTFNYITSNGTAQSPADFVSTTGSITMLAGSTSVQITVPVRGDVTDEADETFTLSLSNVGNATIADGTGLGTIRNDDLPFLYIRGVVWAEGNSGQSNCTFFLNLSQASDQNVSVNYATTDGTAQAGADYVATTGIRTFTPGQTSKTITVPVIGDNIDEFDETFFLTLSNPVNAIIAPALPLNSFNGNAYELITASLNWDDARAAAEARTYGGAPGHLATITSPGEDNFIFNAFDPTLSSWIGGIQPLGNVEPAGGWTWITGEGFAYTHWIAGQPDNLQDANALLLTGGGWSDEPRTQINARYLVEYKDPVGITSEDGKAIATIQDDDDLPTLSIGDVAVSESQNQAVFTLTLTGATAKTVSVQASTQDGTASESEDYSAVSETFTFAPGETTKTFIVPIQNSAANDAGSETFFVNLSNAVNASIADNRATGTIRAPGISINDVTVTEGSASAGETGNTNATFTLTLAAPSYRSVNVVATPTNGTARAPGDFANDAIVVTFEPGETSKTITVPVIADASDEANETFYVLLSAPINALISRGRGVGTILDDDALPTVSIDDVSIGEGNSGQRVAVFRLQLSAPSGYVVKVNAYTQDGTATAGSDYSATGTAVTPITVAFSAGNTVAYLRVPINGDVVYEPNETFAVILQSIEKATLAETQATGTILNDDRAPALTINDVGTTEGNDGSKTIDFTVILTSPSAQTVTVNYATANGVARAGSDFIAQSGTLTFTPGETSKTISIVVTGDTIVESDEAFYILLSGAANASISRGRGIGTIQNDDASG